MTATRTSSAARLPSTPPDSRAAEIVRGLLALVCTLAVAIGVPVGLWAAFQEPWPSTAPTTDWLTAPITTETILEVLAAVVWLAWLHFVLCLAVEFVAEVRGRGFGPRVPGGGVGTQALARRIVATVVLVSGAAGVTVPTASAALADSASSAAVQTVERDGAGKRTAAGPVAERQQGTPQHRQQQPGAAAALRADQELRYYKVDPPDGRNYDTLWDIAQRYLGNGLRYKEIVALNRDIVQPDGTALTNPDLIQPGWMLRLPGDAEGTGLLVADPTSPTIAPTHGQPALPDADVVEAAAPAGDRGGEPEQQARGAGGRDTDVDRAAPPGGDGAAGDAGSGAEDDNLLPAEAAPLLGIAGGLLAAGLLSALRRRRGWDQGPRGGGGGRPLDTELALRAGADAPNAALLDRALRAWTSDWSQGAVPAPAQCAVSPGGVAVSFVAAPEVDTPVPWQAERDGRVWTLRRDAGRRLPAANASLGPLPALVTIGRREDDSLLFVDLESLAGVVAVGGDPTVARDIAISWALEVATHVWADRRRVTLVGFADDVDLLAPDAVRRVDDLDVVIEQVGAMARRQQQACARLGVDSVRTGRAARPDARLWTHELVVCSGVPDVSHLEQLELLASDPRQAVSVVVVGDQREAAVRMAASSPGRLWCGPLGVDVHAQRLTVEACRGLVDLFSQAATTDASGGPSDPRDPLAGMAVDVVDPTTLDLSVRQPVEIGVLGPVAVEADGPVEEGRRELLTEIVVRVATQPEGVHPQVLASAVWPRGVTTAVRDAAYDKARAWMGTTATGADRLALVDGRWRLDPDGVRFDWASFRTLVNESAVPGADTVERLEQAFDLVRGTPWDDLPAGRYSWLAHTGLEADSLVAVVVVARRLAALHAERGDTEASRSTLERGLAVAPAAEELWQDQLRLVHRLGAVEGVREVADAMYATLAREGSPVGAGPKTDALVDELLPGYRRSAA